MMQHTRVGMRWKIWGTVALFVLAIVGAVTQLSWRTRTMTLQEYEAQAQRFVANVAVAMNRSLAGTEGLLAGLDESLWPPGRTPQEPLTAADERWARQRLLSALRQNPSARMLTLLDATGRVLASTAPQGRNVVLRLPDGFFAQAMAGTPGRLVVGPASPAPTSPDGMQHFARWLRLPGEQRLLVIAQMAVRQRGQALAPGTEIDGLELTLEHGASGQILISEPPWEGPGPALRLPSVDQLDALHLPPWQHAARVTGAPALVLVRPLAYPDLRIVASVREADALATWRLNRDRYAAVAGLFVLTFLATGALAHRNIQRMEDAREALARSVALQQQAFASMESGFLVLDAARKVVQWNQRFVELFPILESALQEGIASRALWELGLRHSLPYVDESALLAVVQRCAEPQRPGETQELSLPGGRHIQRSERPLPDGGVVVTYHDVTDIRKASAEIEHLAFYDPLTGLPNRRLLLDRMQQFCASSQRTGYWGAVLFLDLDHFKTLNDTQGHETGDQLLVSVAERLSTSVRTEDTVARLGGDEFVVMLCDLSSDREGAAARAQHIGNAIQQEIRKPHMLAGRRYQCTASLGATLLGGLQPDTPSQVLDQADIAMYQIKSQGRNALCFFDPQMQVTVTRRVQLAADLQAALTLGQLQLHYQPQFHADGHAVGVEALLRWLHPERGMVLPEDFIAVAEESLLIVEIGLWVMQTACAQLKAWESVPACAHLQLAINVSASQLRAHDFPERLADILRESGARPALLKLELTESVVLHDVVDTIAKMEQIKAQGVRFALDDFGTGYSSLAYLTQLPLDQLKIDQSFVHHLGLRASDDAIVQTIIGMAHNLGLEVIAEGVETTAQKSDLERYGCQLFQGFLCGRPMPQHELAALLSPAAATESDDAA